MINKSNIYPVILAGGNGTRLWPISKENLPKQFVKLIGDKSLFQNTLERLDKDFKAPIIITNEKHKFLVLSQLEEINYSFTKIIVESSGRDTAPAISLAANYLLEVLKEPASTMLIMPSDGYFADNDALKDSFNLALNQRNPNGIVCMGASPTSPDTGYGYIEVEGNAATSHEVKSFREKPDLETANIFYKSNNYLWNLGIFIVDTSHYLSEIGRFEESIYESCKLAISSHEASEDNNFYYVDKKVFDKTDSKSIDYAVLEKTSIIEVFQVNTLWSDLGTWEKVLALLGDVDNNYFEGEVNLVKSKNSIIISDKKLIVGIGLDNLAIIESDNSILAMEMNHLGDLKETIKTLVNKDVIKVRDHRKVHRPWGYYDSLDIGKLDQVKRIRVDPNQKLSLQKHKHRSEHWIVVDGKATVHLDGEEIELDVDQSINIPQGSVHSLENRTDNLLEIIEVQIGNYLGEDDIERISDIYGRNSDS